MTASEPPDLLLRRASALRQAGRVEEAIEAYSAYLAQRPDSPNAWYNLAWLLRRARRFEEALAGYGEALARGVDLPQEVHLNRGVILADDLARPHEALAEIARALALSPDYVPALLNLGNLREDRGEAEAARAAYERVLAIEPANATALARLSGVVRPDAPDHPLIARLRSGIRDAAPAEQAELGFALAQALDGAGAYDEAFAAAREANAACRAAAGGIGYDRARAEQLIDRVIAAFDEPPADGGNGGESPVFICGMFRSGSTLAETILARHSRVTAGGELDLLPALVRNLQPWPEAAAAADPAPLRARYLAELRRIHPAGDLVTDKRPDNFLHIGLVRRLFPAARIVHTVRDPRDTLLSIFFLHLDPALAYALDLADAAHWYGQYRRLMRHWQALYPESIHALDYDRLVADPRPEIERLCAFLGLPWEDALLDFRSRGGAIRTASMWQVRQPLYTRSSGRWRNYEKHLAGLLPAPPGR